MRNKKPGIMVIYGILVFIITKWLGDKWSACSRAYKRFFEDHSRLDAWGPASKSYFLLAFYVLFGILRLEILRKILPVCTSLLNSEALMNWVSYRTPSQSMNYLTTNDQIMTRIMALQWQRSSIIRRTTPCRLWNEMCRLWGSARWNFSIRLV